MTPVGPVVEIYIPEQRKGEAMTFRAGAHLDTPTAELLDPSRYCRGCGHCMCATCQSAPVEDVNP